MIQTQKTIKANQQYLHTLTGQIERTCDLCYIGSDTTRLRILYLLKKHNVLCVTDISESLQMGISAVSHQLSILERVGMVKKVRMGKNICYSLDQKGKEFLR